MCFGFRLWLRRSRSEWVSTNPTSASSSTSPSASPWRTTTRRAGEQVTALNSHLTVICCSLSLLAGRDGERAVCILFAGFNDVFRQSTMVFTEQTGLRKLYAMLDYAFDSSRCVQEMFCWAPDWMCVSKLFALAGVGDVLSRNTSTRVSHRTAARRCATTAYNSRRHPLAVTSLMCVVTSSRRFDTTSH